jgi:uncharacterized delta-60 repeat protein
VYKIILMNLCVITIVFGQLERWIYTYNGPQNGGDGASSIVYGLDGNIYAAGWAFSGDNDQDFTVVSLDPFGSERWIYSYDRPENGIDGASSIVYGSDGNIYVAGFISGIDANADFTVISLTPSGTERWVYRHNRPEEKWERATSVVYGSDGNIYAVGISYESEGESDLLVVSLTSTGTERWVYSYNGPGNGIDGAFSIIYGSDGNIYVAGWSYGIDTYTDLIVISLTPSGNKRWIYRYNGPGNYRDRAYSIDYGIDGNIYVAGWSYGLNTDKDYIILSLDPSGIERWTYIYNGPGNEDDGANSIVYGSDGYIYSAGYSYGIGSSADFTVISLTPFGNERWVYRYDGPGNDIDVVTSIVYGSDGNIYLAGFSTGSGTLIDFTVMSLYSNVSITEENSYKRGFYLLKNIFREKLVLKTEANYGEVKIDIYDISGRKVYQNVFKERDVIVISDRRIKELPRGIYILKVQSIDKRRFVFKVIKD